jgi:hypothetical protein
LTEIDSVRDYREQLVHSLEDAAEWRAAKAVEYPKDERNDRSAEALRVAARDVAALPDHDPRLRRLVRLYEAGDKAVGDFLEEEHYVITRHGFGDDATQTTDELLTALAGAADDAVLSSLDESRAAQADDARASQNDDPENNGKEGPRR